MASAPDLLVILCDQLRRCATGFGGNSDVSTPNLDALAADGVSFSNAVSTYPICVPTRFTMLTGAYPHTRAVPGIDWRLSPAERTIAHELREAGYRTTYVGKWHLAGTHRFVASETFDGPGGTDAIARRVDRIPVPPAARGGFEHWQGFELRNEPFDTVYFENDDPTPRRLEGFQTDALFDLAIDLFDGPTGGDENGTPGGTDRNGGSGGFDGCGAGDANDEDGRRDRNDDRPLFAVLSVEAPHPPFTAPRKYLERWQGRDVELRPNVDPDATYPVRDTSTYADRESRRTELGMTDGLRDELRAYYAMVENLDDNVGRLLAHLERTGRRDRTAIAFCSDHGELMGSHGLIEKQHPHEESIGIPFVLSYPGGALPRGEVVGTPVSTEDLVPTLRGLAGLDPDQTLPGSDLSRVAEGVLDDRDGVPLEFVAEHRPGMPYAEETWRGFRTERFKYVVKGGPGGGVPWLLFDLHEDPYERTNLVASASHRSVATDLHGRLRSWLASSGDAYGLVPAFGHDGLGYWAE